MPETLHCAVCILHPCSEELAVMSAERGDEVTTLKLLRSSSGMTDEVSAHNRPFFLLDIAYFIRPMPMAFLYRSLTCFSLTTAFAYRFPFPSKELSRI